MRILHTSDWHLGRSLHGQSLLEGQAAFVDFLVDVVRTQSVDVVLVAGDLYDRAILKLDEKQIAELAGRAEKYDHIRTANKKNAKKDRG